MTLYSRLPLATLLATSLAWSAPAAAQPADDAAASPTTLATPTAPTTPTPPTAPTAPTPPTPPASPLSVERRGNEDADVSVRGTTSETVWVGGRTVEVEASSPDTFAAGERVTLRGAVSDNFVGAGRDVTVKGPVGGDVFLFGETLTLAADVGGDVYAAGESLIIPSDVSVGGNVYFGGANLDLDGTVAGSLLGGGANIALDGAIGGRVKLEAADLSLGPAASIGGDLIYTSPGQATVADGATIAGRTDWTERVTEHDGDDDSEGGGIAAGLGWHAFLFLSACLVGGVLLLLFPKALRRPAALLEEEAPVSLGIGFAVLLGVPVLAVFLALFVLPIPLSLLALAVYLPVTFLARYVAAFALGTWLTGRMGRAATPWWTLVAGLAVLHLGYAVPFLGGLVTLGATVLGLGAIFLAARRAGEEVQAA